MRAWGPTGAAIAVSLLLCTGCSLVPERSTLNSIMREDDLSVLRSYLGADRAWVREHAAVRLGRLGAGRAVPDLEARLESDSDEWVRARCAEALGAIGNPTTLPALADACADDSVDVRLAAVGALSRIGGAEARRTLAELRDDPNLLVRGAVDDALRKLGES